MTDQNASEKKSPTKLEFKSLGLTYNVDSSGVQNKQIHDDFVQKPDQKIEKDFFKNLKKFCLDNDENGFFRFKDSPEIEIILNDKIYTHKQCDFLAKKKVMNLIQTDFPDLKNSAVPDFNILTEWNAGSSISKFISYLATKEISLEIKIVSGKKTHVKLYKNDSLIMMETADSITNAKKKLALELFGHDDYKSHYVEFLKKDSEIEEIKIEKPVTAIVTNLEVPVRKFDAEYNDPFIQDEPVQKKQKVMKIEVNTDKVKQDYRSYMDI